MTIRIRFTLALSAIGVVLFGAYALWAYDSERDDLRTTATREILIVGQSLETSLGNALRDRQRADIEELLTALEALAPHLDIHVVDAVGGPIARSRGADLDPVIDGLVTRALAARGPNVGFDPHDAPTRLIYSAPLPADDGTLLGAMAVARPVDDLLRDLERTRHRLILVVVTFLVATVIAGLVLGTIHVTRPIDRLLEGVRLVREGDFRSRVQPGRADEIGQLVDEFNAMIGALADARASGEAAAAREREIERGLQRVDKLITIGQLSAGLAHEIGSPLQVLTGRASALTDHPDPEVRRQGELLVAQCDRVQRVVEQLLSMGRRKPAAVGPCDLVVPVQRVIELLAIEAKRRGIALELELDAGPHSIEGDPDQLQQVALNLLRNALAATPPGGRITVSIHRTPGGSTDATGEVVRLSVRDTGKGMDAETRDRLFEPFFTTRASEGGTGLGLAVVRTIANEHRARIDVYSEPGCGAELVITFPYHPEVRHG
jgi:signal transduction histidine kinase